MADHDDLQAVIAIVVCWATVVGVARLDKTDIPDPANLYLTLVWTAVILTFSPIYFYWKKGHPLISLARNLLDIAKGIAELIIGGFLTLVGLASIVAIAEVSANVPSGELGVYSVAFGVIEAIGFFSFLGAMVFGYDAVGRLRGRGRRVVPLERMRMMGGSPTFVVKCNNPKCRSNYLASPEVVSQSQRRPDHSVPCQYCGKSARVVKENR